MTLAAAPQLPAQPAADHQADALAAFADGRFAAAARSFESAIDAGGQTAGNYYNAGVAYYRAGDFDAAERLFASLAERFPGMRPLAEYNLGLVDLKRERPEAARRHFLITYRSAGDNEKLRVLASAALAESEEDLPRLPTRWRGALGLRAGHDSNVALIDEQVLPPGDSASSPVFDLFGSIRTMRPVDSGFVLEAAGYAATYPDADDFDTSNLAFGAGYAWNLNRLEIDLGVGASASTLGGDAFDRRIGIDAAANYRMSERSSLGVRVDADEVMSAEDEFAGIEGESLRAAFTYEWRSTAHRFRLGWRIARNDRSGAGVSADREGWQAAYRWQANERLAAVAAIDLRDSEFDELPVTRREDLATLSFGLSYALADRWILSGDVRIADNDSNDSVYAYERTLATVGLLRTF